MDVSADTKPTPTGVPPEIAWLKQVCFTWRDPREPFGMRYADQDWAVATHGHSFVAVPVAEPLAPGLGTDSFAQHLPALMSAVGPYSETVAWDRVERFLADVSAPCAGCSGTSPLITECEACDGEGEIECPHCENEADCKTCDGQGFTGGCAICIAALNKPLLGSVGGVACINRRLLARTLGPLKAPTVDVFWGEDRTDAIKFIAPDWVVVVMPMIGDGGPTL